MPFGDPWFAFVLLPGLIAAYILLHAISPAASRLFFLAASAALLAGGRAGPLALAVIGCHAIACWVDIRRGHADVRRASTAALYLIQFPLLAGGPLVRYADFSGQLPRRRVSLAAFAYGVRRVVTGLVKLLLIARVLEAPIDRIFARPAGAAADVAWFGAACFALQVYFQFSGYADVAVGLGRMLGLRYPENFRRPFTADSLREFWRRWNVTLITWLRDYLSLPIAGQDRPTGRLYLNIVAGFWLIALWHRFAWSALVAGLFFGTLLAIEAVGFHNRLGRWPRPLRHLYVLVVAAFGWMLLRAETPAAALAHAAAMAGANGLSGPGIAVHLTPAVWAALTLAFVGAGPLVPAISRWRVSIDAATASLLMMLAATAVFIWRPAGVVIQAIRDSELRIRRS